MGLIKPEQEDEWADMEKPIINVRFLAVPGRSRPTDRALQGQALSSETPQGEASRHAGGRGLGRPWFKLGRHFVALCDSRS